MINSLSEKMKGPGGSVVGFCVVMLVTLILLFAMLFAKDPRITALKMQLNAANGDNGNNDGPNMALMNNQPGMAPMNMQPMNMQPMNMQPMNMQPMNMQPMNMQPMNMQQQQQMGMPVATPNPNMNRAMQPQQGIRQQQVRAGQRVNVF